MYALQSKAVQVKFPLQRGLALAMLGADKLPITVCFQPHCVKY